MPPATMTAEECTALQEQGAARYSAIHPTLEADHRGDYVAIHIDSGDYAVGRSTASAMRLLRQRHPRGHLFLSKIGDEPEYGLAARFLSSELVREPLWVSISSESASLASM